MTIQLRLLGSPPAARSGADPMHWEPLERKDAAWLALLVVDGPTPRDRIASWLWPDAAAKTAAGSLRQRIFRLRRKLGHELVKAADVVALLPEVTADALGQDHAHAGSSEVRASPAELLAGLDYADCPDFDRWLRARRDLNHHRWLDALAASASRHEQAGELAAAMELAQQLLASEPLSEHAARRVMRLHYLRGDRAAALAVFERLERLLRDELSTRPGTETLELLATVERSGPSDPSKWALDGIAAHSQSLGATSGLAGAAAAPNPLQAVARRRPIPVSLMRPPQIVGRSRELQALEAAWAARRMFLVVGEAGMGKTRLLTEFAATRPEVVYVQARPGDAGLPFALLARLLRALRERRELEAEAPMRAVLAHLLPELGEAAPAGGGEGRRLLLQQAVEWVLLRCCPTSDSNGVGGARAAVEAPAATLADALPFDAGAVPAVLLDDLHFADDASLEMVQALVASERLMSVRFGLAKRPGEGSAAAIAMRHVLAESQRLHEVTLGPLDEGALRELISTLGVSELDADELAAPLLKHTGGNPLFVLETLKDRVLHGAGGTCLPQPATVGALIEQRLRALSPGAITLARVAAIAGVDFGIALAEQVLRTPALALADAWAELEAAQVLSGGAFAHDLVLDAVLHGVPAEIARHVHADVAEVLQHAQAEPARVGAHWEAAARPADAAVQFEAAGARARDTGRLIEARELWQRAARLYAEAGRRGPRWQCEYRSVDIVAFTVSTDAACALAGRLLTEAVSEREQVQARAALAMSTAMAGRWEEAVGLAEAAMEAAERAGHPEWAVAAIAPRGSALAQLGRGIEAIEHLLRTRPLAERAGTPLQHYAHVGAIAYAQNVADRPADALASLSECAAMAREMGDLSEVMNTLNNRAVVLSVVGRSAEALEQFLAARALVHSAGLGHGVHPATVQMNLGATAGAIGRYREALEALSVGPDFFAAMGRVWEVTSRHHLATVWLNLGQWHRAGALLKGDDDDLPASTLCRRISLRARLARLRRDATVAQLAEHLRSEHARLSQQANARTLFALLLELTRVGDADEGITLARQVREHARAIGHLGTELHALMREADLRLITEPDRARSLALEIEHFDPGVTPSDAYLPELWLVLARCWEGADEPRVQAFVRRSWCWVRRAAEHELEPALRGAFLERNPVNREVLAWARRLGVDG